MAPKIAKAIADNPGETDSELVFKAGDLIKVTSEETGSDGWWEGEFNGKVGYFPASFVTYDIETSEDYDDYDGDISSTTDGVVRDKTGRVTYDYEPTGDDDMKAKAGDIIKYAEVPDSPEWVDAELNGVTGYIPKSYIEEVSEDAKPVFIKSESAVGESAGHMSPSVAAALTPPPAPTKKRPKTFYMGSNDIFKIDVNKNIIMNANRNALFCYVMCCLFYCFNFIFEQKIVFLKIVFLLNLEFSVF